MARIGVDAIQVAAGGKGHARSQRRLVEALAAHGGHEVVAFVRGEGARLLTLSGARIEPIRQRYFLVWQQWGMPLAARRARLDALVTLTDRLPLWDRTPYVVWLFELPTHRMEQPRGPWQRASDLFTSALWKPSLRHAARVVAGSQATARELEEAVPELRGRIRVVYPGLDAGFGRDLAPVPRMDSGGRYVFHLASADPRDNTQTVVEAFARARDRLRNPVRLLVGGSLPGAALAGRAGVEVLGYLPDEELVATYRAAAAYLDATLYEGFGYQPLEAMACGAPVVASSASSIPEVVGDGGILCDPHDPEALAEALVRVLEDRELASELRQRGLERAALFTWERTAAAFAEILDEVVGS